MIEEKASRIEEEASLASRLEAIENVVFSRDQSQGEDWEAYCRVLEAKISDLQNRNDTLQRAVERYEIGPQIDDQGILLGENPNDNYQGSIARFDSVRREFVAMKKRLDDTEALEQHYRQRFEHQEEADVLKTAELDRAKRDLDMAEEKRAETERRWLEVSQEKLRVDLDLQRVQLENASITRSRDEISRKLDAAMKESKSTLAKLKRAEALLDAGASLPEPRDVGNGRTDAELKEENQSLLMVLQSYEEKLKQYEGEFGEMRSDGLASKLPHGVRPPAANGPNRRPAALRQEIDRLKAESKQAIQAKSRENEQLRLRLQKAEDDLASMEAIKNDIAGQLIEAKKNAHMTYVIRQKSMNLRNHNSLTFSQHFL
jgi:hypothetical protein